MLVGFDPAKSGRNEGERGFGFLFAARVFNGHTLERPDRRRDYGEERIAAIGRIEAECFAVVYTWRRTAEGVTYRWIISARRANRKERRIYEAYFPGGGGEGDTIGPGEDPGDDGRRH